MLLEHLSSPSDLRTLDASALPELCSELRETLIQSCATCGGHLGPNLGVVELTVALHRVFESPRDRLIFDVSHQTYVHKMLTGRAAAFLDPKRRSEVSGFSCPAESEHDHFAMGHTSTSVSLACGVAKARELAGSDWRVVAIIGDGSLSGGLALEGLSSAAEVEGQLLILVNDNEWSIAPDQGGLYRGLAELRASGGTSHNNLFRALGLDYRYVEDGHDVVALERVLREVRDVDHPLVLHIHTRKGAGYAPAEADPEAWHHVGPFDVTTGAAAQKARGSYPELIGVALEKRIESDPRVVAVCASTPYLLGMNAERRERCSTQFMDVGIAEEHAVSCVTALAASGARPVLGIYSTFLQRAYDQVWHDLCLNRAPATLLVYGAGPRGNTDATHLGFFDLAMLAPMPNLTVLAPRSPEELLAMMDWSLDEATGPVAIRVPVEEPTSGLCLPASIASDNTWPQSWELIRPATDAGDKNSPIKRTALIAVGDMVALAAQQTAAELERRFGAAPVVISARCVSELDEALLKQLTAQCDRLVVLEGGVITGGLGQRVAQWTSEKSACRTICRGLPRAFVDRYDADELLAECGLTVDALVELIACN